MHLLDTDHISLIARGGIESGRIRARIVESADPEIAISIVTYEELMRGWIAAIARAKTIMQQRPLYSELGQMVDLVCATPVIPFDDAAVAAYQSLWIQKLRVGTMDLKIAATAMAHGATVVTRNLADFGRIPGLRSIDWSTE